MSNSNKRKTAYSEHGSKNKELLFETNSESKEISPGDKKLLAQQERLRKAEEEERLKKEKREASEKQKNNKASSSKTKSKQGPSKNKREIPVLEVETSNPRKTRNENVRDESSYQDTRKPKNTHCENKDYASNRTRLQENTSNGATRDSRQDEQKYQIATNHKQNANNQSNIDKEITYHYTFSDGKNDKMYQKFINDRTKFEGKVCEIKGDLFNAPSDNSLAHCVAEDFSMGAGIAKEFKSKFKRVSKLLDQNARTGGLAILEDRSRFIYYLVTKAYSRGKPTLYTLWKSLLKLRDHITKHKVTKLAIPQIGCGLDRLDWTQVKKMLEYIFSETEIKIDVYILDFNPEETAFPAKPTRKCYVKHAVKPLREIEAGTGLVFFGSEDGAASSEMECLAKKYDFLQEYKNKKKSTGDVIQIIIRNEYLYGMIIRRTRQHQIVYTEFEKCLFNLRKMLKADETVYIGIQGFVEKDDEVITDKLVNLMQNTLQDVEIWVCWPEELAHLCPQQKLFH